MKKTLKVFSEDESHLYRFIIAVTNLYKNINFVVVDNVNELKNKTGNKSEVKKPKTQFPSVNEKTDLIILNEKNKFLPVNQILEEFINIDTNKDIKVFNFISSDVLKTDEDLIFKFTNYISHYKNDRVFYLSLQNKNKKVCEKENKLEEMIYLYYYNKDYLLNNISDYVFKKDNTFCFYIGDVNYLLELESDEINEIIGQVIKALNIDYLVIYYGNDYLRYIKRNYFKDETTVSFFPKNFRKDNEIIKSDINIVSSKNFLKTPYCFRNKEFVLNETVTNLFKEIFEK